MCPSHPSTTTSRAAFNRTCASGPCGSGPGPRKGGASHPAGSQRRWLFRCLALRIRDAGQWWCLPGPLKPSMAAVSLAIPGQTAPSRHHHCPAHLAAEPPRVSFTLSEKAPGPFNFPRSAGIGWARPGPCLARDGQTSSLQIPSCPSTGSGHSHLGDGVGRHPITRRVETLTAFQHSVHDVQQLAHAGHDDLFGPLAVRA